MDLNINIPLALKIIFVPLFYKQSKYTNSSVVSGSVDSIPKQLSFKKNEKTNSVGYLVLYAENKSVWVA